jgi:hypothetical protein
MGSLPKTLEELLDHPFHDAVFFLATAACRQGSTPLTRDDYLHAISQLQFHDKLPSGD